MVSLVHDLQKDVINGNVKTMDIVRKAYLIAQKLNQTEFLDWLQKEVQGYSENDTIPSYRKLRGEIKAYNQYYGCWQPVLGKSSGKPGIFNCPINSPIGEIEVSLNGESNNQYMFSGGEEVLNKIRESMDVLTDVRIFTNASQLFGIVDTVRNKILEWASLLEKQGILGDGMSFNKEDFQKADNVTNVIIESLVGNVGSIGSNSGIVKVEHTDNTNYSTQDIQKISVVLDQILKHLNDLELADHQKDQIKSHILEIQQESNKTPVDSSRIQEVLVFLKNRFIGVSDSIIAAGIVQQISSFLSS